MFGFRGFGGERSWSVWVSGVWVRVKRTAVCGFRGFGVKLRVKGAGVFGFRGFGVYGESSWSTRGTAFFKQDKHRDSSGEKCRT